MDPNANLAEQEDILGSVYPADYIRLAILRAELDRWLKRGGFEPDWSKAPNARKYYGR